MPIDGNYYQKRQTEKEREREKDKETICRLILRWFNVTIIRTSS